MDRLEDLQKKYQPALEAIHDQRVQLTHLHVDDDKLVLQGSAPSEEAKNAVMEQIKAVDPSHSDVTCELTVTPPQAPAPAPQ